MPGQATTTRPARRRSWPARRVWLPAPLYESLPWIYCLLGAAALTAGLFLPQPAWVLPYLFLLAVTAVHLGAWCYLLRRRSRSRRQRRDRLRQAHSRRASPNPAAM